MRIVVATPSGNIGRAVVARVLDTLHDLVMVSRHPDKVSGLVARLVHGSLDDPAVLDDAMRGADALLWITPFVARADYMGWATQTAGSWRLQCGDTRSSVSWLSRASGRTVPRGPARSPCSR